MARVILARFYPSCFGSRRLCASCWSQSRNEACQDRCDADPARWAVECGESLGYCSWWAIGVCELEDSNSNGHTCRRIQVCTASTCSDGVLTQFVPLDAAVVELEVVHHASEVVVADDEEAAATLPAFARFPLLPSAPLTPHPAPAFPGCPPDGARKAARSGGSGDHCRNR